MSRFFLLCLLPLLLCTGRPAVADTPLWSADFAEARARAGSRLVLVNFTGSDWCVWCRRLKEEVLTKSRFLAYAREHLVLVELDFPREKQLPPEQAKQNAAWAQKYAVTVYPTLLVLNATGEEVGRIGYMQGGPQTFVRELQRLAAPSSAVVQKAP